MFKLQVRLRLSIDNYWHLESRHWPMPWSFEKLYSFDDLPTATAGAERLLDPKIINFPIKPPPAHE